MRFSCFDSKTSNLLYRFDEVTYGIKCDLCLNDISQNPNGMCNTKNCFFYKHPVQNPDLIFQFCFLGVKTQKEAKYNAKLIAHAFLSAEVFREKLREDHTSMLETTLHNMRHYRANIRAKLEELLGNEENLSQSGDRIEYINNRIGEKTRIFARNTLSIWHTINQMALEDSIPDIMSMGYRQPLYYSKRQKAHTLVVMCFYHLEQEFKERKMRFDIASSQLNCHVDASLAKTAIYQLLQNSLKYGMPDHNNKIDIRLNHKKTHVEIIIRVFGLTFYDKEKEKLLLQGYRGVNANKHFHEKGSGIGFAIVDRIMKLHNGYFDLDCDNTRSPTVLNDIPYSQCTFVLGFPIANQ